MIKLAFRSCEIYGAIIQKRNDSRCHPDHILYYANNLVKASFGASNMPGLYSTDLRWRIVFNRRIKNRKIAHISRELFVHYATVLSVLKLFDQTSDVVPKAIPGRRQLLNVSCKNQIWRLRI